MIKRSHQGIVPGAGFRRKVYRKPPMTRERILKFIKAFPELRSWFILNKGTKGVRFGKTKKAKERGTDHPAQGLIIT